jgi:enterochelin esterase-like enzyme
MACSKVLVCTLQYLLLLLITSCRVSFPFEAPEQTPVQPTAIATANATATPAIGPAPDSAEGFETLLAEIEASSAADRQNLVNRFTAQLSAPITSQEQAIFLWRGEAFTVQLLGDMNNWNLADAPSLTRLGGTDLWYLPVDLEHDARLEYQFVVDDTRQSLDLMNSNTVIGREGANSELIMPGYETPPELLPSEQDIPTGTVTEHTIHSDHLSQSRTLFVYAPPGQLVGQRPPTLYFNNGGDYMNQIDTPLILDRLIAQRQIPPLVAVFIPPIDPLSEYALDDNYVNFLADEVVPFIRETYDTAPEPGMTGIIGPTAGGGAALYAALERPEVFGLAAGQSVAPLPDDSTLIRRVIAAGQKAANEERFDSLPRIALVVGSYETAIAVSGDLLAANRRLSTNLEAQGYDIQYEERPEGHGWRLWRGSLGSLLRFLFQL